MTKSFYEQLNDVLKDIKKEGKIEDVKIEEVVDFDEEEEYEEVEANIPTKRVMKGTKLKKGLVAAMLALSITGMTAANMPSIVTDGTAVTVEAASKKKDKKKPTIKFSGKTKLTAYKNKSVKIPKTTAKDNKDGNVTKKIKVTVKKGKKSYSSIAKKIKNNKSVKFTSTGKYVITYTVTDKAGNKATKKRYVTVKNKSNTTKPTEETTEKTTTETPTTEQPTTEQPTTEQPSTEKPTESTTQEDPKPETPTIQLEFDSDKYTISCDETNNTRLLELCEEGVVKSDDINLNIENNYSKMIIDEDINALNHTKFLDYFGTISATDADGNDISDKIKIEVYGLKKDLEIIENSVGASIFIYVEDGKGNIAVSYTFIDVMEINTLSASDAANNYQIISEDPFIIAKKRNNTIVSSNSKKLKFIKERNV